jgi:hypothetical protein
MEWYLIESNQTASDCHDVDEQFIIQSHIMNFEWGYQAGEHTAWAVFETENESEALFSVPPSFRSKARAIRLNKFSPLTIEQYHK